jgi:hypothetical protein
MPFSSDDTITGDRTVDTSPSEDPTIEDDCPMCQGDMLNGVCLDCPYEDNTPPRRAD